MNATSHYIKHESVIDRKLIVEEETSEDSASGTIKKHQNEVLKLSKSWHKKTPRDDQLYDKG